MSCAVHCVFSSLSGMKNSFPNEKNNAANLFFVACQRLLAGRDRVGTGIGTDFPLGGGGPSSSRQAAPCAPWGGELSSSCDREVGNGGGAFGWAGNGGAGHSMVCDRLVASRTRLISMMMQTTPRPTK